MQQIMKLERLKLYFLVKCTPIIFIYYRFFLQSVVRWSSRDFLRQKWRFHAI